MSGREALYIGTKEDCNKMLRILKEYYKYTIIEDQISVEKVVTEGSDQDYIQNVLNGEIKYGE